MEAAEVSEREKGSTRGLALPHSVDKNKSLGSPNSGGEGIDPTSLWEEFQGLNIKSLAAGGHE